MNSFLRHIRRVHLNGNLHEIEHADNQPLEADEPLQDGDEAYMDEDHTNEEELKA